MLLTVRKAGTEDVPLLVDLYERERPDGYSASFDRYGPITPEDFWWIQTEKEVLLLEVDHRPAGLVILGRREDALIAEEVIAGSGAAGGGAAGESGKSGQAFVQRLGAYLLAHFRRARQERLLLRTTEANPLGLALARSLELTFASLLVVTSLRSRGRHAVRAPQGYALRKATAADATELARVYRESYASAPEPTEIERLLRRPEVRGWVAERDRYMVGFLLAEAHRGGFGDLAAGVREPHRRRGIGRALATPALNFFHTKGLPAIGLCWGSEAIAQAYYRRLGFATEHVYLFFEKSI